MNMEMIGAENLLDTYKTMVSRLEPMENRENKILVPININLFRHSDDGEKFREPILNFKYRDEYTFDDRLLIYDAKTDFNGRRRNLLGNLRRSENIDHYIKREGEKQENEKVKVWNNEYLRKSNEHVDWTDNGYGLRLSEILSLEPSHKNVFSPADKNIRLNYDHKHSWYMDLYSLYLIPGRGGENFHQKIRFGKLKKETTKAEEIFEIKPEEKNAWCRIKNRDLESKQIGKLSISEEGYEGACDILTIKHGDLNSTSREKWSTSYVFHDYRSSEDSKWHEYYQYVLGEYSVGRGLSENLLGEKNGRVWAVDYTNIFKIEAADNHLRIGIDERKLPGGREDFLKISDLFNFEFSYREREEYKKASFDIGKILEGEGRIFFGEEGSMFSDFSVTIGLRRENTGIELMDGLEEKKYTVNVENLLANNMIQDHIHVERPRDKNLMSSQFWKDEEMANVFRFSSPEERKMVGFSVRDIKKMNVHRDYNDEDGILKIKFKDFLSGKDREIIWEKMGKIPTNHKMVARAEDEESAKNILKQKEEFRNLPQYFWDSIRFTPQKYDDFWVPLREHKITYGGPNWAVREQWNKLINSQIYLFNDLNFHVDSMVLTEEMARRPVKTWFKSMGFGGNEKELSRELIFTKTDQNERYVKVTVSVNNGRMSGKRDFDFQIVKAEGVKKPKISKDVSPNEEDSPFNLSENVQKIIAGSGCAIAGGGIAALCSKASVFFRKKF